MLLVLIRFSPYSPIVSEPNLSFVNIARQVLSFDFTWYYHFFINIAFLLQQLASHTANSVWRGFSSANSPFSLRLMTRTLAESTCLLLFATGRSITQGSSTNGAVKHETAQHPLAPHEAWSSKVWRSEWLSSKVWHSEWWSSIASASLAWSYEVAKHRAVQQKEVKHEAT